MFAFIKFKITRAVTPVLMNAAKMPSLVRPVAGDVSRRQVVAPGALEEPAGQGGEADTAADPRVGSV